MTPADWQDDAAREHRRELEDEAADEAAFVAELYADLDDAPPTEVHGCDELDAEFDRDRAMRRGWQLERAFASACGRAA